MLCVCLSVCVSVGSMLCVCECRGQCRVCVSECRGQCYAARSPEGETQLLIDKTAAANSDRRERRREREQEKEEEWEAADGACSCSHQITAVCFYWC